MSRNKQKPVSIFALIDIDNQVIGYFKDEQLALDRVERDCMDEAIVLEVISAFDIIAPEEPEYKLEDKKLLDMLRG